MRTWLDVAELVSTKNLNGGLVARSAAGLPFLLFEGMELALVPPVLDAPRNVTIASLSMKTDDEAVIFLDEVKDIDTAKMLVGCHCLALRDGIDIDALDEYADIPSWDGWEVSDVQVGKIGSIDRIDDRSMQPLLVVLREDGSEALIPLVDEFIVEIDEDNEALVLNCPPGLLDL